MLRFKKSIACLITASTVMLSSAIPALATIGMTESTANDSVATATVIPSNFNLTQEIQGSIENPGDVDYYKFVPLNSAGYSISTLGSTDTFGYLYDSNMNILDVCDDEFNPNSDNLQLCYNLTAGNTYYIKVSHKNTTDTGNYTLKIDPICNYYNKEIESNNSFETATSLSGVITNMPATIGTAGDEDYYALTLPGGGTFSVETTGSTDTFGAIYDSNHNLISADDNNGEDNNMKIISPLAGRQTYYVKVNHASPNGTGSYNLKISQTQSAYDLDGSDFSSAVDLTSATSNAVSHSGLGINYSEDIDFFKFTPRVDGIYTFKSSGLTNVDGTVLDNNHNILKSDKDSGADENFMIDVSLTANQTYYLMVSSYPGVTGSYSIDIAKGKCLNVPQYLQLPYDMLCWASSTSMAISYFNHDTIDRTLEIAQNRAKIDYASSESLYGPDYYKYPSVFNQPHELINCSEYIDPSITPNVRVRPYYLEPQKAYSCGYTKAELIESIDKGYPILAKISNGHGGAHVIVLKGYMEDTNGVINTIYNDPLDGQEHIIPDVSPLTCVTFYPASPLPTDNEPVNNTLSDALPLTNDQTVQGSIGQVGDVDFYKFSFGNSANHQCIFETTGTTDTYGEVYDINGNLIASADNGGEGNNFKIQFTSPAYTQYYVKVTHSSNGTGSYTLNYTYN
ncbi:papain-like cysteine protease family protein [Clostridium cellulovorans]|uniref:Peptidase domain protein n=1 Tax=Clostridium cellulovorans (strain ATCC 35296 / DSM 3052 / OCM 3 / 743B) TaxID=573061 RepID=D9ST60_CLOC7|nr:papain-like cysteine protease family protein [Clostridium cellulovorans]ADL50676.1 peptidase domain protein [Clostridium cellulovorans 743B]